MGTSALSSPLRIATLSLLAIQAQAGFKILCFSTLRERLDPIISPGAVSQHVHLFSGANSLNYSTSSANYSSLVNSKCTSCEVKEDKSLYWVPQLYYQAQNGSFTAVPIDGDYDGLRGGITTYYQQRGPGQGAPGSTVNYTAFPAGFRMIAGDPFKRNYTSDFAGLAVSFECEGANGTDAKPNSYNLPNTTCSGGIRAQLNFPHCWNGKDVDPPDHKSHMSYALPGNVNGTIGGPNGGVCPDTHPYYMLQLFYEVLFRTDQFPWWSNTQPFVFANGDPTGYGYHGDFVNGWNVQTLQNAANTCNPGQAGDAKSCTGFTIPTFNEKLMCTLAPQNAEDITGPMSLLPGCNAIQSGPASATAQAGCTRTGSIGPAKTYYADQTQTNAFKYIGCGNDTNQNEPQTFKDYYLPPNMTVEKCVGYCNSNYYLYAGLEYRGQCFCGNTTSLPNRLPQPGILGNCDLPCDGNKTQYCGGNNAISLYQRCTAKGPSCQNSPSA